MLYYTKPPLFYRNNLYCLVTHHRDHLRLNVGFIAKQAIGFSRNFVFEFPTLHLKPDLDLEQFFGEAIVTRTNEGLLAQVKIKVQSLTNCSRCLEEFSQPLIIEFAELFAFSSHSKSDTELVLPEDGHIDLGTIVREYALLEAPINPLCQPECNGLCPMCGNNLNSSHCDHATETTDTRLSILKKLLDDE